MLELESPQTPTTPIERTSAVDPMDHFPISADPLGEVLHSLRMAGVIYGLSEFSLPWGRDIPAMPGCLMFHVVTEGSCWLPAEGADPLKLAPGGFVLVPHGEGHLLLSDLEAQATPLFDVPCEKVTDKYEIMRHGGGGEMCKMICGAVRFARPAAERLLSVLPKRILIDAWRSTETEWMHSTLRLMAQEVEALRPGGETVVTRLADIFVVQAIRTWIASDPAAQQGWLGALRDPAIGRALQLVQRRPEEAWSVESLAEACAMSRSAFAARFAELVGETPIAYVRRWKMRHALTLMRDEGLTVGQVSRRLGYESEASFSRAFKREMNVSPAKAAAQQATT